MLSVILIHLAGLASPGPDFFYVSRQAVNKSIKAGFYASLGIAIGIMFWAGISLFGIKILNFADHLLQYLIMLAGGLYLAKIGVDLIRIKENIQDSEIKKDRELSAFKEIKSGLIINLCNAKAGIYFASIVSSVVLKFPEKYLFLLWLFFIFSTFLYFCLISLLFSRQRVRNFYSKNSRKIDNCTGIIFFIFGIILIYEAMAHFLS